MKLRIYLTIIAFGLCLWSKYSHTAILGMDIKTYQTMLKAKIQLNSIDFAAELPYTLMDTAEYNEMP